MTFILFISFVILLRIIELLLSKRNEIWLLQNGAVEYGQKHYPFIVALHVSFFIAVILEYSIKQNQSFNLIFLIIFSFLLAFKIYVILLLGNFWNTKIYRIKNIPLQKSGPYKYIKHPNYIIVTLEIAVIPLALYLYYTAIIFTLLNAIMLYIRIKEENKALEI